MPRSEFGQDLGLDLGLPRSKARARRSLAPRFDPSELAPERSAWESALTYLGRPGYAIRDLFTGNVEGAGRQVADILGETVDAFLPGDLIPEASRPEDYVEGSDLLRQWGGPDLEPGVGKLAADIGIGLVTDPLTYLGLGPAAQAGKAARSLTVGVPFSQSLRTAIPGSEYLVQGAGKAIGGAQKAIQSVPGGGKLLEAGKELGHGIRSTFAALRPTPQVARTVAEAEALGGATRQAAQSYPIGAFQGLDPDTQRRAIELVRGVSSEMGPGYASLGVESAAPLVTAQEQAALLEQRLALMPWDEPTKQAVREAAGKTTDYFRGAYSQAVGDRVLSPLEGATSSLQTRMLEQAPPDYFPGRYNLPQGAEELLGAGQPASFTKSASITNADELAQYLTETGGKLDTNLPQIMGEYGEQLGRATQSAKVAAETVPDFRALSDPESRTKMTGAIDSLRKAGDLDSARVLETAYKGLSPRGKLMNAFAKLNSPFKKAATAGVVVPRLNFTIRNIAATAWQALSNPEARGAAGSTIARMPGDFLGAMNDGLRSLGITALPEGKFAQVTKAALESGGTREGMLARITDPRLKEAVQTGVLDGGFVSSEELGSKLATQGDITKPANWLNWTQELAKSAEQHMRFGMFNDLRNAGKSAQEAARITQETLYDYKLASAANRTARDIIPFFQFTAKAIPQTAKFIAEQPAIAGAIRPLYTQDTPENPVYPYLQDQPLVPLGDNDYLTSFGLPFEVMGNIPNLSADLRTSGDQARRGIVGQTNPLLKTAYSYLSGRDPAFDSPWLGFDKAPAAARALGADENGELWRYYNALAGTGTIQPLVSTLSAVGNAVNPDLTPQGRALSSLTGLRVVDVDEDRALRQVLEQYLSRNPSVRQRTQYYGAEGDEETRAINRLLGDITRRQRKERERAALAP